MVNDVIFTLHSPVCGVGPALTCCRKASRSVSRLSSPQSLMAHSNSCSDRTESLLRGSSALLLLLVKLLVLLLRASSTGPLLLFAVGAYLRSGLLAALLP